MKTKHTSSQKRTFHEDWKMFLRGLKVWLEICPQILIYRCLTAIANIAAPYFPLYMSALLINELAEGHDVKRLLTLAAIVVTGQFAINIITRLLQGRESIWMDNSQELIDLYTMKQLNHMQYEHLENAEVTLLRERINAHANASSAGILRIYQEIPDMIANLFSFGISLTVTATMFRMAAGNGLTGFLKFMNSPMLAVLFISLLILNAFLSVKIIALTTAKAAAAMDSVAKTNTFNTSLQEIFGEDAAIFNLKKPVLSEWKKQLLSPRWAMALTKTNIQYHCLSLLLNWVLEGAVFLITAAKAFTGVFGIGNFLLYRGTVSRFASSITDLSANVANIRENNRYLQYFFDLMDLPDTMYHGTLAVEKRDDIDYEIEFRDVSFRYPGTDAWVLRDVNMKFRIGDKLAIVGENGSGKTTFIKLLCRLYDPTEGTILLNGIDITKYRYDEYISLFSVVFQDYTLFQFSLASNVAGSFDYDSKRVEECLIQAGFGNKLQNLENGIETVIGRDYENDGIDLSGGEEQKIALARALYKNAPFVVLDEPTAALDPIAEAAVYESFRELTKDKTAVFISHRLSSCRLCDDIIVFEKGRLIQRGNHDKLLEKDGKYRQLWDAQAKYYVTETAPCTL